MKAVIDATIVVRASVPSQPGHEAAREALSSLTEAVAPHVLFFEVTTSLRRLEHAGTLAEPDTDLYLSGALQLRIRLHTPEGLFQEALALARTLGVSRTQDAAYLALARREGCPLYTMDGRFQRNASGRGYDVRLVPEDEG